MYQFTNDGYGLHFEFPEGQIDLNEVLQAAGQAVRQSLRAACSVRVTITGIEEPGIVEARHTDGRIYPPICDVETPIWRIPPDHGYTVYVSPRPSPFYRIIIPGAINSLDQHVMAVAPEFDSPTTVQLLFNLTPQATNIVGNRLLMPPNWRLHAEDYNQIRHIRDMLTKKPRVPKPVDINAILTKLFGEKIAAAIVKEIK